MKHTRLISFITGTVMAIALFFGVGPMHSLFSSRAMHSMQNESIQCQSICPPLLNEKQKTPQVDEDDADPDPMPYLAINPAPLGTAIYSVLFAALLLRYLRRRPPDLVLQYGNWRN